MDLGHDQQQHPTVHTGGNSRGRVSGCTRREIECLPYAGFFGYIQCSVADIDWSEFVLLACTVRCTVHCAVRCMVKCSVNCTVKYTIKCTVKCTVNCKVKCKVNCTV